jgi:hypothetical protein
VSAGQDEDTHASDSRRDTVPRILAQLVDLDMLLGVEDLTSVLLLMEVDEAHLYVVL